MLWLIILGTVGLVFAPALWLRPSPRQQRVVRLRDLARESGVTVRIETSPLHDGSDSLPAYRWLYPVQRPGPDFLLVREALSSAALKPLRPGWRWRLEPLRPLPEAGLAQLEKLLAMLPDDVAVVESGAVALTLWWEESSSLDDFKALAAQAGSLRDALEGRPDRPEAHRRLSAPGG